MRHLTVFLLAVLTFSAFGCSSHGGVAPCPTTQAPVCGSNGTTYANQCFAEAEGIEVAHAGECSTCGGILGGVCAAGQFCEYPEATCGVADMIGLCVAVPEACAQIFDPVCGCDGVTYSNDCVRRSAAVRLDHDGGC